MVCSRLRASLAVRRDTPAAAGRPFSQTVICSPVSELSCRTPQYGRMNLPIRYSRFSVVLRPTSCVGLPAFDPIADRDLTRRRVVPCARADLRLLVPSPDESCLLRLEAGLAGFAARDLVLDAPRSRSLAAFLRVRHSSPLRWAVLSRGLALARVAWSGRLLAPGATSAGHGWPGTLGHDLRDVVITEPEVLADERTGNRPSRRLAAKPRFANPQDLCRLSWRVKLSHLVPSNHYKFFAAV